MRSSAIPSWAPTCCVTWASTGRWPRSCSPITSGSTAGDTRTGSAASEIPEIAKIISVAEVYDTLTASDTYRTQMSSFEALRELRRVSGSQLDERYVEVLAGLLTGEGVEYRHADMADFDTELNMERRIREASAGA